MSMEKELGRIADALERIETKIGAPLKMENVPAAKAPTKRKSTRVKDVAADASGADFGGGAPIATPASAPAEPAMTPEELLAYANGEILGVKDTAKRAKIVQKLKAMFVADYGVTSVKAIPADKIDECKDKFAEIMKAGM